MSLKFPFLFPDFSHFFLWKKEAALFLESSPRSCVAINLTRVCLLIEAYLQFRLLSSLVQNDHDFSFFLVSYELRGSLKW